MLALKPQSAEIFLGELPGETAEDKIEVTLRMRPDGSQELELTQLAWGTGVGWFVQKTMTLDGAQMQQLKSLLTGVRTAKVSRKARREGEPGRVIPFPTRPVT
jgi:hypothetical protein